MESLLGDWGVGNLQFYVWGVWRVKGRQHLRKPLERILGKKSEGKRMES